MCPCRSFKLLTLLLLLGSLCISCCQPLQVCSLPCLSRWSCVAVLDALTSPASASSLLSSSHQYSSMYLPISTVPCSFFLRWMPTKCRTFYPASMVVLLNVSLSISCVSFNRLNWFCSSNWNLLFTTGSFSFPSSRCRPRCSPFIALLSLSFNLAKMRVWSLPTSAPYGDISIFLFQLWQYYFKELNSL